MVKLMASKEDSKVDTWMPLWIGAYLADTMKLTTLQHGAYMLLLMAYWRERAPLRDSDDELRSITKTDKSEWKKLRPVLASFFRVADGVWWHKRVEAEIAIANARKEASLSKAKAGAQARWNPGSGDAPSNASSIATSIPSGNAPSNASSTPQALLEDMPRQCPPPSPINTLSQEVALSYSVDAGERDPDFQKPPPTQAQNPASETSPPSLAAQVCTSLKRLGMASVSAGNRQLLALLDKGVTVAMFEDAATKSIARGKGFAYMLAIVADDLKSAAAIEAGPSVAAEAWDATRQTIEAMGVKLGLGKWDESAVINREQFSAYTNRVRQALEDRQQKGAI